jgi:hypothetical protein
MRSARPTVAACVFVLVSSCLWPGRASADVDIVNNNGWRVYTNGRLNAFYSYTFGDGFPNPPVDPMTGSTTYSYIGGGLSDPGITDAQNKIASSRIRSGFVGSIMALGLQKTLAPGNSGRYHSWALPDAGSPTTLSGYFAIWTGIQTQHTRFGPVTPDVRESYLKLEGPWGSVLVGRTLGLFGKASVEIDFNYGHGNGLGYPCQLVETTLATCGQIGFGVLFPYYSAGIVYKTPTLAGFALAAGLYDPVTYPGTWELTPLPRPEAELTYDTPLGDLGKVHVAAEGLWQRVGNVGHSNTADAAGVAGGVRLELGPVRLGLAAHYGTGLGFFYALEDTPASVYTAGSGSPNDPASVNGKLRVYDGYYGQLMLVLGKPTDVDVHHPRVDLAVGYGAANLHQLEGLDVNNPNGPGNPGLIKQQAGINGGVFYHIDENLVASLDYFRADFTWYDGAKQGVNSLNTGLTMTW